MSARKLLDIKCFLETKGIYVYIDMVGDSDLNIEFLNYEKKGDGTALVKEYIKKYKSGVISILEQQITIEMQFQLLKVIIEANKSLFDKWKEALADNSSLGNLFFNGDNTCIEVKNDCIGNDDNYDAILALNLLFFIQFKPEGFKNELAKELNKIGNDFPKENRLLYKIMCINILGGFKLLYSMQNSLIEDIVEFFSNQTVENSLSNLSDLSIFKTAFESHIWNNVKGLELANIYKDDSEILETIEMFYPYLFSTTLNYQDFNLNTDKKSYFNIHMIDFEKMLTPRKCFELIDILNGFIKSNSTQHPIEQLDVRVNNFTNVLFNDSVLLNKMSFKKNNANNDCLEYEPVNIVKRTACSFNLPEVFLNISFKEKKENFSWENIEHRLLIVCDIINKSEYDVYDLLLTNKLSVEFLNRTLEDEVPLKENFKKVRKF